MAVLPYGILLLLLPPCPASAWVFYPGRADILDRFSWTLPVDVQVRRCACAPLCLCACCAWCASRVSAQARAAGLDGARQRHHLCARPTAVPQPATDLQGGVSGDTQIDRDMVGYTRHTTHATRWFRDAASLTQPPLCIYVPIPGDRGGAALLLWGYFRRLPGGGGVVVVLVVREVAEQWCTA